MLDVVLIEDLYDALVDFADEVVFLGRESEGIFPIEQLHESGVYLVELGPAALSHLLQILADVFDGHPRLLVPLHERPQLAYQVTRYVFCLLDEYGLKHRLEVLECLVRRALGP